jgi:soluble lytic murein transglycosylase
MIRRGLVFLAVLAFGGYWWFTHWREHRFDGVIAAAANRYQMDPALVKAVVWQETRFRPNLRGRAGEVGLMQVREDAAMEWASSEHILPFDYLACLDPATNTLAGTWYLKKILQRYQMTDNALPYALADYNAGRGNVLKWRTGSAMTNSAGFVKQIGFPGVRAYVQSVTRRYQYYK